ncbi:MAG: response regulator [Magnetococcus sp. YQC-5]
MAHNVTMMRHEAQQKLETVRNAVKTNIENHFQQLTNLLRTMKHDPVLYDVFQEFQKNDATTWNTMASRFEARMLDFAQDNGLEDILLITQDGVIVYTLKRAPDLGQNLTKGTLRDTPFAEAWREIQASQDDELITLADFAPWKPAGGTQSGFILGRIHGSKELSGYIALRYDTKQIHASIKKVWDTPLISQNEKLDFFLAGRIGGTTFLRNDLKLKKERFGDRISSPFIDKALAGEKDTVYSQNETGIMEFVSYAPVQMNGLQWVVMVTEPVEDAMGLAPKGANAAFVSQFIKNYMHHDFALIAANGMLFVNITKEDDYSTNLLDGPYRDSNHGRLIRQVIQTKRFGIIDFEPYAPSHGKPSAFVAMPVLRHGEVEMVVSLQLSLEFPQKVMHERDGMGKTGESYLVGPDKRMRSNSHGDPVGRSIEASFAGDVKNHGVDTESVRNALAGQTGIHIINDYRNTKVLSAYTQIKFEGINWALLAEIDLDEVAAPAHALLNEIMLAGLILIAIMVLIALMTTKTLVKPLQGLMQAAGKIAAGEHSARVEVTAGGEFGELGRIFNIMATSTEEQFWLQSNLAKVTGLVQACKRPQELAQQLISHLVPLLHGGHGAFYVQHAKSGRYELLGSYGFKIRKNLNASFVEGEGLVGQAAMERQTILLTNAPGDYIKINSGLGEATPMQLLIVPMLFQDSVLAVIEIASFNAFTSMHQSLMEGLQGAVGLGISNLHRNIQTQELLEETQIQSEELVNQQEELKKTNESLQLQTEELQASKAELQAQQEELETANQVLREQKTILEKSQTDLEFSQKAVEEKAKDLALASKYKSEFLANMSHELRTPLNSLLLLSRMLADNKSGNLTADQIQSVRIIHEGGTELLELINDILDLSKIEAGKMHLHVEPVPLSDLKDRLLGQFTPLATDKGLEFAIVMTQDAPAIIHTDEGKMGRILKNFLSNAFKFTETGRVEVRIEKPTEDRRLQPGEIRFASGDLSAKKVISLSVSDTGIGIAQEKLGVIFEAFQQADGGTSRKYGGTGLGLSIARELARLLNGELRLRSEEGKGSIFTLLLPELSNDQTGESNATTNPLPAMTLPFKGFGRRITDQTDQIKQAAPALVQAAPALVQETGGDFILDDREVIQAGDKILLVIEDNSKFATVVCSLARKHGFKTIAAPDGESGLALAVCFNPTGIILDRKLPGMNGDAVLARLKESPATRQIPVHIISGRENGLAALGELGAVGVLAKPVTERQLKKVFERIECANHASGGHLLVVEDDPTASLVTVQFFKSQGIHVTAVGTAKEALQLLQGNSFACMILDLDLPGMSGFELLEQITANQEVVKIPVIIYSGRDLSREEYSRLRLYTDSVIMKGEDSGERLMHDVGQFLSAMNHEPVVAVPVINEGSVFAGERILLVDDDMRNLFAMSKILQSHGLHVLLAPDGRRALELLDKHTDLRLVLMDVMMPVMDGLEAIRLIRQQERFKELPIIILSAKAMVEDRERGLAAGANAFLSKPVNTDHLLVTLREYLTV